jgi:hypothetical protein
MTRVVATAGLAEWLRLAATPTFAIMALLTSLGGSPMERLCSSGHGAPLNGMAAMYLLMSAFHSPPWLSLVRGSTWRRDARYPLTPAEKPVPRQT